MLRSLKTLHRALSKVAVVSQNTLAVTSNSVRRNYSIYEPDYLHLLRPAVPIYDTLNIQITGYDFPILENYQKFVHDACESLDIEVEDAWALPSKQEKIVKYKPTSVAVVANYELRTYKRTVQIVEIKAHLLPTLIRLIEAGLPEGVSFNVVEHTELHEYDRYVPDKELLDLKDQLVDLGGPSQLAKKTRQ